MWRASGFYAVQLTENFPGELCPLPPPFHLWYSGAESSGSILVLPCLCSGVYTPQYYLHSLQWCCCIWLSTRITLHAAVVFYCPEVVDHILFAVTAKFYSGLIRPKDFFLVLVYRSFMLRMWQQCFSACEMHCSVQEKHLSYIHCLDNFTANS